jgi:DNA-binding transcriptional regulator GbsR (MarR family)
MEFVKKTIWLEKWLSKRKCNLRHLRKMIKNTKRDKENDSLMEARKEITRLLDQKYDVNSPESVFRWLEDLEKHLRKTAILLEKAKDGLAKNSRTEIAYKCTENLLKKIHGRLRDFHSNSKTR